MATEFEKALKAMEGKPLPKNPPIMFLVIFTDEKSPTVESLDFCLRMLHADGENIEWGIRSDRLAAKVGEKEFYEQAYQIHARSLGAARMVCRELGLKYSESETFYVSSI